MTSTDYFGQSGYDEPVQQLPGPNDPIYHLATVLGMMSGDRYATTNTNQTEDGYTSEDLLNDSSAVTQTTDRGQATKPLGGVLDAASKYLGIKYVYGGTDPKNGMDCSGFVQRAFADVGVMLPRVTYDQVKMGVGVAKENLQPGDLIFLWGDGNRKNGHVGIYVGNGVMIDSPHTGSQVGYHPINWGRVTDMRRVG